MSFVFPWFGCPRCDRENHRHVFADCCFCRFWMATLHCQRVFHIPRDALWFGIVHSVPLYCRCTLCFLGIYFLIIAFCLFWLKGNIIGGAILIGGSEYYMYHWHTHREPTRHIGKQIMTNKKRTSTSLSC